MKLKIGDLISPKLHEQFIRTSISGDKLHFKLESNVTVFFKDVTLEIVNIYVSNDKNMDDLLICIDPNVGGREWFQIKTRSAKIADEATNLTEHPTIKLTNDHAVRMGRAISNRKETKMIDLRNAAVGDKFMTTGSEVTLMKKGNGSYCLEYKDGSLMLTDNNGKIMETGSPLLSKVDTRHWLKYLPDAGLFSDDVEYIHCRQGVWCYHVKGWQVCHEIHLIKMPILTDNDYNLSMISVVDLKAWQMANPSA